VKQTPRLGYVETGLRHEYVWTPAPGELAPGGYAVTLRAFDDSGRRLRRTARASGRDQLTVSVPPPAAASVAGVFPVQGAYSFGGDEARFGAGRDGHTHQGQDVSAGEGTPVVAPLAGTVTWVAFQARGAGHYVVVGGGGGRAGGVGGGGPRAGGGGGAAGAAAPVVQGIAGLVGLTVTISAVLLAQTAGIGASVAAAPRATHPWSPLARGVAVLGVLLAPLAVIAAGELLGPQPSAVARSLWTAAPLGVIPIVGLADSFGYALFARGSRRRPDEG
jgi:hypothetical protein